MNVKEPLLPQDVPLKAWHTLICSDLFYGENADYLLVTDYGNNFPVMKKLPNTQSSTVIAHLKSIFDEHGIPSKLVTDNGAQYTSSAFQEFNRSYGFTHVVSSPFYPQSNGLIKRTVQPVKDLKSVKNLVKTHIWQRFVSVAPHSVMIYHRLQNF